MRSTDIRVVDSHVEFRTVAFQRPLVLSERVIHGFTVPYVRVEVADRRGSRAVGIGSGTLSVLWAWPHSMQSPMQRDTVLRDLVTLLVRFAPEVGAGDPVQMWHELHEALRMATDTTSSRLNEPVPALAAGLALAPLDAAIHDAWGKAAGLDTWTMYDAEHLNDDLSRWLGSAFADRYPAEFLFTPRHTLAVQHVLGVGEPITSDEARPDEASLEEWIQREGVRHIKIKLSGSDPAADVDRVRQTYRLLVELGSAGGSIALDPNEAYAEPDGVIEFLDRLRRDDSSAWALTTYLEQPIPRDAESSVLDVATRIPVLADEGLAALDDLAGLASAGWSGVAVKAAKGHTMSLLAACWAAQQGLYLTVQDLTNVDLAFTHSACLASRLPLSSETIEYNSRQYAPRANDELVTQQPKLAIARDGTINVGRRPGPGLY